MIDAVAYMRCSGDSQAVGDTWNRQTEQIQALAARQGMTVVKGWREKGVSGTTDCEQRPAWQEMLAELLSNGCRTIIVLDLSRLARRYAVQEQILFYLCAKGITLWTCAGDGEDVTAAMMANPTKRLLIGIVGLVSQWECETLVARNRAARKRIKAEGRQPGAKNYSTDPVKNRHAEGRHPFGWKPGERTLLQQMVTLKSTCPVCGGTEWQNGTCVGCGRKPPSTRYVARCLNDAGTSTRYGKAWIGATVARILARESKCQVTGARCQVSGASKSLERMPLSDS